jgi:hypothetical protein
MTIAQEAWSCIDLEMKISKPRTWAKTSFLLLLSHKVSIDKNSSFNRRMIKCLK